MIDDGTLPRSNRAVMRLLHIVAFSLLAIPFIAGCRTEPAMVSDASFPTRISYSVPPKELFDKARTAVTSPAIDLAVDSQGDGRIVTQWKPMPGAHVTVAGVGRAWQERTRYTIIVTPSWDDPTNKSSLEVMEESQQRPHDKYAWDSQDPIKRPDRAAHLAQQLDNALRDMAKK